MNLCDVFNRSYGQNFLVDDSIGSLIVYQARLRSGDRILEIGPGRLLHRVTVLFFP